MRIMLTPFLIKLFNLSNTVKLKLVFTFIKYAAELFLLKIVGIFVGNKKKLSIKVVGIWRKIDIHGLKTRLQGL